MMMAIRKLKDDPIQTEHAADAVEPRSSTLSFEARPAADKADFDARLTRVMGKISKTRSYLAK
ncbi:hypothetical protein VY88_23785 [Azospirillum thiophilum]|uniref:Uncharacterized protein n=2 Tax=Azospirillum thiophilum TaxID=528244 RepID=A0AAC8W171_9PROT|nr:hypothetical protein [Azospirillum thiophilum]ALG73249.1 hypothetical protein AL072_19380 [Azospirillum thiophilum]KJR63170.1 hypothetical protein VY88_23785 [Azospirillum thiophilum]